MLLEGDVVYTRELSQAARGPMHIVRRLVLKGDRVEQGTLRNVHERQLLGLQRTERQGQLLATWVVRGERGAERVRKLLDANTLEDIEGEVPAEESTLLGVQAGRGLRIQDGMLTWTPAPGL